jgi:hypothetical protein
MLGHAIPMLIAAFDVQFGNSLLQKAGLHSITAALVSERLLWLPGLDRCVLAATG